MSKNNQGDFKFEKFISDIVRREIESRERLKEQNRGKEELPAREYIRRYTERVNNSIRYKREKK